nr:gamma carbonic anhydrase family protein [Vibrio cidicii]
MNSTRSYKGIYPQIGARVYIDSSSVLIGDIHIGDDSSIWPLVAARGDVNHIRIGERSNIQDGSVLHVTHKNAANPDGYPLIIGNDVTVGHKVMLHGCTIKDRVLVGMGAIVLDGVIIEEEVMIGAGSLVPPGKVLESGYLYVGSPVKQARPLTDKERAFLQKSADNYVQNKNDYLSQVKVINE